MSSINADALIGVLERIDGSLAGFHLPRSHGKSFVASVERWICNHQSADLMRWNSAMTGKK